MTMSNILHTNSTSKINKLISIYICYYRSPCFFFYI